jgi:hypothetical protein
MRIFSQVGGGVRLVSKIGIILEREGEFSIPKVSSRYNAMVQPLEEVSKWEQALIKGKHDIRVDTGRRGGRDPVQSGRSVDESLRTLAILWLTPLMVVTPSLYLVH